MHILSLCCCCCCYLRCVQSFDEGDYIIRQGEEGTRFFIINDGEVRNEETTPPLL